MFTSLTLLDAQLPAQDPNVTGGAAPRDTHRMARLSEAQIQDRVQQIHEWTRDGNTIRRQFVFDGFASAVAFVVRIGFDAEAADHHPDVLISNYKKVTVTFTTHSAGGLTEKDFAGAEAVNRVFAK